MEWSGSILDGVWLKSGRAERLPKRNIRSDTRTSPSQKKNSRTSSSHLDGVSAVALSTRTHGAAADLREREGASA